MSDSREALFQAVIARPADDEPRERFAAYCDEHGDPYGAFIRAQLAQTRALRAGADAEAWRLDAEASELERQHRTSAWKNGIEALARSSWFIRGFVESIIIDARDYLERADELYRRAPIRHLVLTEAGDRVLELARDPHLAQVVSLGFGGGHRSPIRDAGLEAIAASPFLRNLKALEVADHEIGMQGLEALCASTSLPSLLSVNLTGNRFEEIVEEAGADWATGATVPYPGVLPPLGRELEARFGELAWLHAPSRLRHYPPMPAEL